MAPTIATNKKVDRAGLEAFLRAHHRAVVMTTRRDGRPQASPVTCGLDDEGRIVISTYPERAKTHNARRNPAVSVVVGSENFAGAWVQVDGRAEVLDMPESLDALVDYYRCISGEHPDWDEYRAAMERERRVLVRVELRRAGPDRSG
jgi:PPOX class probable F420-dependent enzyme